MGWKHYRLVFRLKSTLHIGYRKVGNLMQTRRYVPGKNLWAALTERIVWLAGQGNNADAYRKVGKALREDFRFGYLWPTYEGRTTDYQPHFPWKEPQGPEYWDYLYLDSTARTALAPDVRTAAEGALHEVEFIAPYTREGMPIYLVGDLWVRDNLPTDIHVNSQTVPLQWREAIQSLQIGGERTYGWGQLQCCTDWQAEQSGSGKAIADYEWEEQNDEVVLKVPKEENLTAHMKATGESNVSGVVGLVEPLIGWERNNDPNDKAKSFWKLSNSVVCWAPGGKITEAITVQISENGLWQKV